MDNSLLQEQIELLKKQIELQDTQIKLLQSHPTQSAAPLEINQQNDVRILFTSSKQPFSLRKVLEISKKIPKKYLVPYTDPKLDELKKYLETYFACLYSIKKEICFLHWDPYKKVILNYDNKLGNQLPKSLDVYGIGKEGQYLAFSPSKYVKEYLFDRYRPTVSLHKPLVFIKKDQYYYNNFSGFLHNERKQYCNYPDDIKQGVEFIWNHINEVWCSTKKDQFEYVVKWICAMVSGQKMTTCLYLNSLQGSGKTAPCDFLRNWVIGKNITITINNPKIIVGGFNISLCGMLLTIFEELPSNSKGQWKGLVDWLKPYITNSTMNYEGKYEKDFNAKNLNSYILLTNKKALKISPDDRRFVMLDVSNKYIGNYKYIDKLVEYMDNGPNCDIIGEAFYWYCIEFYENYVKENNGKHFNPQKDRPNTILKQETIIEHLHTLYVYLKREFILKRKGIPRQLLSEFTNKYKQSLLDDLKKKKDNNFCHYKNHNTDVDSRKIAPLLRNINIQIERGTGNQVFISYTPYEDLLKIFVEKKWIDDYDDHNCTIDKDHVRLIKIDNANNVTINNIKVSNIINIDESEESSEGNFPTSELKPNEEPFDLCKELQESIDDLKNDIEFYTDMLPIIMEPYSRNNDVISLDSSDEESIDESHVNRTISKISILLQEQSNNANNKKD